jgi:signal transduction histidine kinase
VSTDGANATSTGARLSALQSWRGNVLRALLTVAAIVAPSVVLVSLVLRSGTHSLAGTAGLVTVGLAFPLLRLAPGLSVRLRARLAIALLYAGGVLGLTMFGFTSGPGILLAGTSLLAVVLLGRRWGLCCIGMSVAAFFVVGALASRGTIAIGAVELDPHTMRNWIRVALVFAFLAVLLTTAIDFVIRHVEESSRAASESLTDLRAAYERLALLHERVDTAKEEERRFIAHELHDELGQMLTVVKLRLGGAMAGNGTAETIALVDGMLGRVRKISGDLRPPLLDEVGLLPALRAYADAQAALSGVPIDFSTEGGDESDGRLDASREIACFRVVQESLTNALRHAAPGRIRISVVCRPASISLSIVDDGRGFQPARALEAASAGHLGIVGMQERVRARGGSFRISSRPGTGTTVDVEIPIETSRDALGRA